ncbi:dTDP-4-dehydrorhamnose 3,5-epimerase family protein [Gammaproteobacteria bacterium]|nr:dTDP-4-dehydrorhamnose 3,5-epimerase family protein [Gammaproteobacteria bacterium]
MSIDFSIIESEVLADVKIITPSVFQESRGSIWTSYGTDSLGSLLPGDLSFKHDKFSQSNANVLRGIHGDHKSWKLVSCIHGQIKQVVVDMRASSKTYLKWESFDLGTQNRSMILIPPGMGNAFYVSSSSAIYHYKLAYSGDYIDADEQFTVSWNDPRINIKWPTNDPILSERDARL